MVKKIEIVFDENGIVVPDAKIKTFVDNECDTEYTIYNIGSSILLDAFRVAHQNDKIFIDKLTINGKECKINEHGSWIINPPRSYDVLMDILSELMVYPKPKQKEIDESQIPAIKKIAETEGKLSVVKIYKSLTCKSLMDSKIDIEEMAAKGSWRYKQN